MRYVEKRESGTVVSILSVNLVFFTGGWTGRLVVIVGASTVVLGANCASLKETLIKGGWLSDVTTCL